MCIYFIVSVNSGMKNLISFALFVSFLISSIFTRNMLKVSSRKLYFFILFSLKYLDQEFKINILKVRIKKFCHDFSKFKLNGFISSKYIPSKELPYFQEQRITTSTLQEYYTRKSECAATFSRMVKKVRILLKKIDSPHPGGRWF